MKKILMGLVAMVFQITVSAMGYNAKLLDQYVDTSFTRITAEIKDDVIEIGKRLSFLSGSDEITDSGLAKYYGQSENFSICMSKTAAFESEVFTSFVTGCKSIFETANQEKRIAVHMLLERVLQKYTEYQQILQKRLKKKAKPQKGLSRISSMITTCFDHWNDHDDSK